jgi:hypothetical protein
MPDDQTPQFFTPDVKGDSQSVYKVITDNLEALQSSQMQARNRQFKVLPSSTLTLDGIPGVPFERANPNPDLFFQGEDVIYDLFLFHDGSPVSSEEYDVAVLVKTSPRAGRVIWEGKADLGVYPTPNQSGYYEVWIPSSVTESMMAGSYYVDVQIKEKLGSGKGRFDRKYIALQTSFNVEYSNFSPHPETAAAVAARSNRSQVESTWPNSPNTIGNAKTLFDEVFYSTE